MATAGKGVKRKRRPKSVCPNPVFVKWLEEWRDEAIENGWKTSYSFNKARDQPRVTNTCVSLLGSLFNEALSITN